MKFLVDILFYELSKDIICLQLFLPTKNAYKHRCVHSRSTSRQFYSLLHPKQYRAEPRVCIIPWILPKIHILFPWLQQQTASTRSLPSSLQSLRVTSRKQGGIRRRSLLKSRFQSIFVPVQFSQSRSRRSSSPIVYCCFAENPSVRYASSQSNFSTHGTKVSQRLATCPSARHFIETAAHLLSSILNQVEIFREDHNSHRIATGKSILRIVTDYRCILFEFLLSSGEFDYA